MITAREARSPKTAFSVAKRAEAVIVKRSRVRAQPMQG